MKWSNLFFVAWGVGGYVGIQWWHFHHRKESPGLMALIIGGYGICLVSHII